MVNTTKLVPFTWYLAEEYDAILNIMADRENLPRSYDTWLKKAMDIEQRAIASGYTVERVIIHPEEFSSWCNTRGLDINAEARGEYISSLLINKVRGNSAK